MDGLPEDEEKIPDYLRKGVRRKTEEISLPLAATYFVKLPRIKNPSRIFKAKGER